MNRVITDTPATNAENLLNFAYAENGDIYIRDFNGEKDVNICDVVRMISKIADRTDILDDFNDADMMEAFIGEEINYAAAMLILATQAAELRGVVKRYEDLEEAGLLVKLPCKVGDTVYVIRGRKRNGKYANVVVEKTVKNIEIGHDNHIGFKFGTTDWESASRVFLTREEAEAALKGAGDAGD